MSLASITAAVSAHPVRAAAATVGVVGAYSLGSALLNPGKQDSTIVGFGVGVAASIPMLLAMKNMSFGTTLGYAAATTLAATGAFAGANKLAGQPAMG